jgi:hypothetical protein
MSKFSLPTETVELPSKGLLYPESSPLKKGTVEMKYMTAREEDILTNNNYIQDGTAIDRAIKSLIVDKAVNYDELLVGDKNALMVAARILAYGKDYPIYWNSQPYIVDLSKLDNKPIDEELFKNGNKVEFKLPNTDNTVTVKLLSHSDQSTIDDEVEGKKKIEPDSDYSNSTRLKHIITSINGETDAATIRDFVDNGLTARDGRWLRAKYNEIQPDILLTHKPDGPGSEEVPIPIGIGFFYPSLST